MDMPTNSLVILLCTGAIAGLAISSLLFGAVRKDRLYAIGGAYLTVLALWVAARPGSWALPGGSLGATASAVLGGLAAVVAGAYALVLLHAEERHAPLRARLVPLMVAGGVLAGLGLLAPAEWTWVMGGLSTLAWLGVLVLSGSVSIKLARSTDAFARAYLLAVAPLGAMLLLGLATSAPWAGVMAALAATWLAIGLQLASAEQQRLVYAAQLMDMELLLSNNTDMLETMQHTSLMLEQQVEDREIDARNSRILLEESAYHDKLTGLPNRRLLADRFAGAVSRAKRSKKGFSLVVLDVDSLRGVNDHYGHVVGDQVLRTLARRIDNIKRDSDTFARLEGDDFVLLLHETETPEGLQAVCEKIQSVVRPLMDLDGLQVSVTVSLGAAVYNPSIHAIDALYTLARLCLMRAKEAGGNRYVLPQATGAAANESAANAPAPAP
jgi:diguanylate cyclase (GGDEF)-like protein